MISSRGERRLAAIMFTDIQGYTSLTEKDEKLAFDLLEEHRRIVRSILPKYNGKEIKTIGDSFLVEFASAFEAIECATSIQESMNDANRRRDPGMKLSVRIGIHLGDVMHSENDVYGDAVNVASRIEPLAEAGGICISRQVYESVRGKVGDYKFESIGPVKLKNLENAIEVFKTQRRFETLIAGSFPAKIETHPSQISKNRIAVLPFLNISPDPSDEFFADGLTEEMIARLSEVKSLRVIARTSIMNYKKIMKNIGDIGRELAVGTVVEGSVRKAGNKIRVTVQVINTSNEEHLWSSTYDRNLDDIFSIQEDIASNVASSLSARLRSDAEQALGASTVAVSKDTQDISAYTDFLRARKMMEDTFNEENLQDCIRLLSQALERDSRFARAYALRSTCYFNMSGLGMIRFDEGTKKAEADAKKSLEIDPSLPDGYVSLARAQWQMDDMTLAEKSATKAIELNPSYADAYHMLSHIKSIHGKIKESVELLEIAYRLDPLEAHTISHLAFEYVALGEDGKAIDLLKGAERLFPAATYEGMARYYLSIGNLDKAGVNLEKFKKIVGESSLTYLGMQGVFYALKGEKSRALEIIGSIEKHADLENTVAVNEIGFIYHALGNMDKFFEYMERANEIHALPVEDLRYSRNFEAARKDPRFRELCRKLGIELPDKFE